MQSVSIRNNWISFRGSSKVKDLQEQEVYNVEGRFFSFTRKKFVKDLEGNVLFIVRNKFWSIFGRNIRCTEARITVWAPLKSCRAAGAGW